MKKFILISCVILLGLSHSSFAKQTDYILCSVETSGAGGFISQVTSGGIYAVFAIDEEYMRQIAYTGNKDTAINQASKNKDEDFYKFKIKINDEDYIYSYFDLDKSRGWGLYNIFEKKNNKLIQFEFTHSMNKSKIDVSNCKEITLN